MKGRGDAPKRIKLTFPPWAAKTFFLLACGLAYIFVTPLFEAPDEMAHFIRAYGVSEGHLILRDSPKEVVRFVGQVIRGRDSQAFMRDVIEKALQDGTGRIPNLALNVSMYSPLPYIPDALIIKALQGVKDWHQRLMLSAYLCRLASLMLFVALMGMTFRLAGQWGWPFFWIASTPMALSQASIISVDYAVFSAGCLIMAASIGAKDFRTTLIYLVPSALLVALTKFPYFPLLFFSLVCMLNRKGWGWKSRIWGLLLVVALPILAAAVWNAVMFSSGVYDEFQRAMLKYGGVIVDTSRQMDFVAHDIFNFMGIFVTSLIQGAGRLYHQFVGVFGLLDTPIPVWAALVWGGGCAFSVILSRGPEDLTFRSSFFLGLWLVVTAAAMALCVGLSAYVVWMPVEATWINLQGRYFHLVGVAFLLGGVMMVPLRPIKLVTRQVESAFVIGAMLVNGAALLTLIGKY